LRAHEPHRDRGSGLCRAQGLQSPTGARRRLAQCRPDSAAGWHLEEAGAPAVGSGGVLEVGHHPLPCSSPPRASRAPCMPTPAPCRGSHATRNSLRGGHRANAEASSRGSSSSACACRRRPRPPPRYLRKGVGYSIARVAAAGVRMTRTRTSMRQPPSSTSDSAG